MQFVNRIGQREKYRQRENTGAPLFLLCAAGLHLSPGGCPLAAAVCSRQLSARCCQLSEKRDRSLACVGPCVVRWKCPPPPVCRSRESTPTPVRARRRVPLPLRDSVRSLAPSAVCEAVASWGAR